jgi:hypothetical protein
MIYQFTNRPWLEMFKFSEKVCNWSYQDIKSINEGKERLCKLSIEGIDEERCWLDAIAENEA